MSLDQAKHLRIVDPGVNDDLVTRRMNAIRDLSTRHRRQASLTSQLNLAEMTVRTFDGTPLSDPVRAQVVGAVRKAAPSFLDEGDIDLDLNVVAILSVASAIDTTSDSSENQMAFLASAVALGLNFRGPVEDPKLEALRLELIALARSKAARNEIKSRERRAIPSPIDTANYLRAAAIMAENATMDREEVNLLWWVINDWSVLVDVRISAAPPAISCLISGIETAGLLAEPAARAHRDLALRNLNELDATRSALQLAEQSIDLRPAARRALTRAMGSIERSPTIFPALAIATLPGDTAAGQLPAGMNGSIEMSLADWCRRVVDEVSLLKRLNQPVDLAQQVA